MHALIIGAAGGIGRALLDQQIAAQAQGQIDQLFAVSRQPKPSDIPAAVEWFQVDGTLQGYQQAFQDLESRDIKLHHIISTIGWLHQGDWGPERRIEALNEAQLAEYFAVNASLPILILQALKPLLPKNEPAVVAQLGAKVASISDNHLGGWYGYRASKAALNMLFKTAAIEFKRTHKQLCLAVIHPGTTDTELSKPFQQRIADDSLFTPELSAQRILAVIANLSPEQSGGFWFWDGKALPY